MFFLLLCSNLRMKNRRLLQTAQTLSYFLNRAKNKAIELVTALANDQYNMEDNKPQRPPITMDSTENNRSVLIVEDDEENVGYLTPGDSSNASTMMLYSPTPPGYSTQSPYSLMVSDDDEENNDDLCADFGNKSGDMLATSTPRKRKFSTHEDATAYNNLEDAYVNYVRCLHTFKRIDTNHSNRSPPPPMPPHTHGPVLPPLDVRRSTTPTDESTTAAAALKRRSLDKSLLSLEDGELPYSPSDQVIIVFFLNKGND